MTIGMKYMTARTSILIGAVLHSLFYIVTAFAESIGVLYFTVGLIPGRGSFSRLTWNIRGIAMGTFLNTQNHVSPSFTSPIHISSAECYNVLCPLFKKNEYYIPLELESNVLSP